MAALALCAVTPAQAQRIRPPRIPKITHLRGPSAPKPPAAGYHALPAVRERVPLGAAVEYACVDPTVAPPPSLTCPFPYDSRYAATFEKNFDMLVPQNELKMWWLQPQEGMFDFTLADRVVAYAYVHDKHVRGHTLLDYHTTPGWITGFHVPAWTRQSLLMVLKNHITTVMQHYKRAFPGVIREWDVVNEAFDDQGELTTGDREFVDNIWYRVIGADYIEKAFEYARAADPDALLFYNEYNADRDNRRARAVYRMAADFRRRGVPLDGIGMEMHVGTGGNYPPPAQLLALMKRYRELGLRVEMTEADVGTSPTPEGRDPITDQAAIYRSLARDCARALNCTGLTVWGVTDRYSWRGPWERPLLFSDDFTPKSAYGEVRALLAKPAGSSRSKTRHKKK